MADLEPITKVQSHSLGHPPLHRRQRRFRLADSASITFFSEKSLSVEKSSFPVERRKQEFNLTGLSSYQPSFASPTLESLTTATPKANCRIEIDNVHPSSYFRNKGVSAIKVNARSICNVVQENVVLTVNLYKTGFPFNHLVTSTSTNPSDPKSRGLRVENNMTFARCITSRKTTYFGIAYAKATILGIVEQAPAAQSVKKISIACGT
jgi:hypothetical protein